jgi:hypothetical protein
MSTGSSERKAATCPICGGAAEIGCLYGRDDWSPLRWLPGEPSWLGNVATARGGGDPVGDTGWLSGPHAPGLRCDKCRRIILDIGDPHEGES